MSINLSGQSLKKIEHAPEARVDKKADNERLKALAAQFESLLVGQMMQQMRSSLFDSDEGGDKSSAPLADALFSELSLAMSRSGGLGLADSFIAPLERQNGAQNSPRAGISTQASGLLLEILTRPPARVVQLPPVQYSPFTPPSRNLRRIRLT